MTDASAALDGAIGLQGLVAEENAPKLLEEIIDSAVRMLTGIDGASVTVRSAHDGRPETMHASSTAARVADEAQYRAGRGPCVEALMSGREVTTALPTAEWPEFSDAAFEAGFRRVWSLPLGPGESPIGALNLYVLRDEGAAGFNEEATRGLANQAALVLSNALELMNIHAQNKHLVRALETRTVIGQAQGILMARQGVDADSAFDMMRRASQRTNTKLYDIACNIVNSLNAAP